jgi:hypothetical protein
LDERGLGVRFYPGPVWINQTHKAVYNQRKFPWGGVQSGNVLNPSRRLIQLQQKIRQTQSLKA